MIIFHFAEARKKSYHIHTTVICIVMTLGFLIALPFRRNVTCKQHGKPIRLIVFAYSFKAFQHDASPIFWIINIHTSGAYSFMCLQNYSFLVYFPRYRALP